MSIVTFANLLHEIQTSLTGQPHRAQLNIEDLEIDVHGEDSNLTSWIDSIFGFICNPFPIEPTQKFTISVLASNDWLNEIIALNDADQFPSQIFTRRYDTFNRIQVSERLTVDYFPELGVAWVTDSETNQIGLIHSTRTAFPDLELRVGIIDIINRHLETQGWHTFHSGAVIYNDRLYMIVGDSGAGKTTLVTNLIHLKATYIANERLFVRKTESGINVRAFPQTIGIGLGTALQLPALEPFIHRPDHLRYFQKVFEPQRVYSTPPEEWSALPDKLKFLPSELTNALGAPAPASTGQVAGILFPNMDGNSPTATEEVPQHQVIETLSRNYFASENDQLYPRWLTLPYEYHTPLDAFEITTELSKLPTHAITFLIDKNSPESHDQLESQLKRLMRDSQ